MDLAISSTIAVNIKFKGPLAHVPVDPYDQYLIDQQYQTVELPFGLAAGESALLSTVESIEVPAQHIGEIGVRSTWARLGLISPLTKADPGFRGQLTLEVFNAGANAILLQPDDKILNIHYVYAPNEPMYNGRYQDQVGLQLPRALKAVDQ